MAMPEVRDQLLPLGLESIGAPTDAFLGVVRAETARYAPLIKELGIRLD